VESKWWYFIARSCQQLRWIDTVSLPPRPGFSHEWLQMRFVWGRSGIIAGFSRGLFLSMLTFVLQLFQAHLSPSREMCDTPEQAAHCRTVGSKLMTSSLTQWMAGLESKCRFSPFQWSEIRAKIDENDRSSVAGGGGSERQWTAFTTMPPPGKARRKHTARWQVER
jgi:hypothetical protein